MRKLLLATAMIASVLATSGCARNKSAGVFGHAKPDEFAVSRSAPLVIPPDFALTPPKPGTPRPQEADSSTQALQALFGGRAQRSAGETAVIGQAGANNVVAGTRSAMDPNTTVVDKGSITRDIIAAPTGAGQDASASTNAAPAPAATPAPTPQ
jgi:hypothetical protein